MEPKIEKITRKDIEKEYKKLSTLSAEEKDAPLAFLFVAVDKLTDIVGNIVSGKQNTKEKLSEVKEIENILSLGPSWLNYTVKIKKKK